MKLHGSQQQDMQNMSHSLAPTTFQGLLVKSLSQFELQFLPYPANEEHDFPLYGVTGESK